MQRIAIHSVPRSGSTWLGELFNSHPDVIYKYQPLFSYAFKGKLTTESTLSDILSFYDEITISNDDFLEQKDAREEGKMPMFLKSSQPQVVVYKEVRYHHILENLLNKDTEIKVIGLIRNPLAVINSWLKAPKEFRQDLGWNEIDEWRYANIKNNNKIEEFNGFEKWKEVTLLFLRLEKEYPDQFKTIHYSELIRNTTPVIEELFTFCNMTLSENTKQFILQSKKHENIDAYSVFKTKTKDDSWKNSLNNNIVETIVNELRKTELEKYLK